MPTYHRYASNLRNPLPNLRNSEGNRIRNFLHEYSVSTAASISFNFPLGLGCETLIYGMDLKQSLHARELGALYGLVSGIVYATYRDGIYKLTNTYKNSSPLKKTVVNTMASLSYGLPIYASNLWLNGVNKKQIAFAMGISVIVSIFAATPYGIYLDLLRKRFNTPSSRRIELTGAES